MYTVSQKKDSTTEYVKNYCNWILIDQVIVEHVVTFFSETQCISRVSSTVLATVHQNKHLETTYTVPGRVGDCRKLSM